MTDCPQVSSFVVDVHDPSAQAAWVHVRGELDFATAPALASSLVAAVGAKPLVVVDLRELRFIDASGLYVLLEATRRARATRRRVAIVQGRGLVARIFDYTGTAGDIEVLDVDAATAAVEHQDAWTSPAP